MQEIEIKPILSKEAKFYTCRLLRFFEVKKTLDDYPLDFYAGADCEYGISKEQLKKAIYKAIFSSYTILHDMDFGYEVDQMIEFDRISHARKAS